jgi:hypothetical protein
VQKAEFCGDFKNVQKCRVWQKGKKLTEKLNFSGLEKFSKKPFL